MLPELKERFEPLQAELKELTDYMDSLPEDRRYKSPEGSWNAVQIFYHLKESEKGTAGYLGKKIQAPKSEVSSGGLSSKLRSKLLSKSLRNHKMKFKAPAVFSDMPSKPDYETVRREYMEARKNLEAVLEEFETDMLGKAYFKHPVAGRITIVQTLKFLTDHFERHREQIYERSAKID